jgi:PIN domain nuclease of toxin-antitoxin system
VRGLLVDTHAVLWWLADDPVLPEAARAALADPGHELLVSAASLWEVAIKRATGRLEAPDELPELIAEEGFAWLSVSARHAWEAGGLPFHHRDPFDRLLIAQARVESLAVVTGDPRFGAYGVPVLW